MGGGGCAKGMLAPSQIIGGRGGLAPRPLSSYAYESGDKHTHQRKNLIRCYVLRRLYWVSFFLHMSQRRVSSRSTKVSKSVVFSLPKRSNSRGKTFSRK